MLDGRVKTLHPHIHGGILAVRDNPQHQATLKNTASADRPGRLQSLSVRATVAKPGSTHEEIIENIDIGGPSMVRAAAKNYRDVAVVTDPAQYAAVLEELQSNQGGLTLEMRERLAAAAFAHTAAYDRGHQRLFCRSMAATSSAGRS